MTDTSASKVLNNSSRQAVQLLTAARCNPIRLSSVRITLTAMWHPIRHLEMRHFGRITSHDGRRRPSLSSLPPVRADHPLMSISACHGSTAHSSLLTHKPARIISRAKVASRRECPDLKFLINDVSLIIKCHDSLYHSLTRELERLRQPDSKLTLYIGHLVIYDTGATMMDRLL